MADIEVPTVNETSSYPTGLAEASLAAVQANQSLFQESWIRSDGDLWQNSHDDLVSETRENGPGTAIAVFGIAGAGSVGLIYGWHRFQDNPAFRNGMFREEGALGAFASTPSNS